MKKITGIEGLDAYEDHDLTPTVNLDKVNVKFVVEPVLQSFILETTGRKEYKNVVHVDAFWELGRSGFKVPIKDVVEFNKDTSKWVIKKLAEGRDSYIRLYPEEWNAFYHSTQGEDYIVGTPLDVIFKNDPAKVYSYRGMHVESVEALASLSSADISSLGLGGQEDVKKAKEYLERISETSSIEYESRISEAEEKNLQLQEQIAELAARLEAVLTQDVESRLQAQSKSQGKPKKAKGMPSVGAPSVEGLE